MGVNGDEVKGQSKCWTWGENMNRDSEERRVEDREGERERDSRERELGDYRLTREDMSE